MPPQPDPLALELAELLSTNKLRVAFAESCTSGMVAALMGQVPGISQWFCGSAVTYREATKVAWLGAEAGTLEQFTAESQETTVELAVGVLDRTPEADVVAAVTGHLGPDATGERNGLIFITVLIREPLIPDRLGSDALAADRTALKRQPAKPQQHQMRLKAVSRIERQREAAMEVLRFLKQSLLTHLDRQ